jgi:hypothetical protein
MKQAPAPNRKQRRGARALNAKRVDERVQAMAPDDANSMLIENRRGFAQAAMGALCVECLVNGMRALNDAPWPLIVSRLADALARMSKGRFNIGLLEPTGKLAVLDRGEQHPVAADVGTLPLTCEHGDD